MAQAVHDLLADPGPLYHPALLERLQVACGAGLGQPHLGGQIGHAALAADQHLDQAKPGGIAEARHQDPGGRVGAVHCMTVHITSGR
jgi:hypothetical protein